MAKFLKRRTIGPAYERCPAERLGEWTRQNTLMLIASVICVAVWWGTVTGLVYFFNWLSTDGDPAKVPPFDADAWYALLARLIGSFIIFIIMLLRSRAR